MLTLLVFMGEILLQVDYAMLGASLLRDVCEYIGLSLCTLVVAFHSPNDLHCIATVLNDVEALESTPECTITQMAVDLNKFKRVINIPYICLG